MDILMAFLIGYFVVNLLIFLLQEKVNEGKASLGATILIALFGLPLFVIAGVLVLKDAKK